MATHIKTLKQGEDTIIPRTKGIAVTMEDGTNLEYAMKNQDSTNVKVSGETASSLGVPEGASINSILIAQNEKLSALVPATVVE